jgi:very-short-patch-repair endonuclease
MDTEQIRSLRKAMSHAEVRLWNAIRARALGVKFRRQAPIGCYVVDFVCLDRGLVVEVDGSQHADSDHDRHRDAALAAQGYKTLRF